MQARVTGRRDINKAGGEEAEFPILCETCLGPNPYVRMTKQPLGAECKVCTRPFTVFRWQPGSTARFKKTEICQTCSKSRNVCQTCLLDLQFGLPTQVRDTALGIKNKAPTSDINREYYAQNVEKAIENGIEGGNSISGAVDFGKSDNATKEMLKKLARQDPAYHRNKPHICSFFVKGTCTRGEACPYRHEMPKEGHTVGGNVRQSIQDRYHGKNDPVARKMLAANSASQGLTPPADTAITSLYLTSVPSESNSITPLTTFVTPFLSTSDSSSSDALKSVVPVPSTSCAFLNFRTREIAEEVAEKMAIKNVANVSDTKKGLIKVIFGEDEVGVQWGRSRKSKAAPASAQTSVTSEAKPPSAEAEAAAV